MTDTTDSRSPDATTAVEDCLFCRIVAGRIPATVVRRTDRTLAFRDVNPVAPTHVLVVPTDHHATLGELAAAAPDLLVELVQATAAVADQESVSGDGYRTVFNSGPAAGQTVFHVHAHVLGGRPMGWPPG